MSRQISKVEDQRTPVRVCLTIAGLDPSGGAGIVADIKTFSAFGCFAAAAVTSVTYQNTTGVFGAVHQTAESVHRQVAAILDDYDVAAIKTGMLPTREIIETVARIITERKLKNVVVDPVVRSTSGYDLIDDAALGALVEQLFPLADVITPNLPEAERVSGIEIASTDEIAKAAQLMQSMGARNVLIKGGHVLSAECGVGRAESKKKAVDHLFTMSGVETFEAKFIETTATHGTGCVLSAAIAANLALGNDMVGSIRTAKEFVTEAIRTAPNLGHGNSPVNI